jgi:1,4-alpha-glucan branching enzyme
MAAGRFCLVLHGHLPWVLHHGRWPHGEDWIFEAASATWLPLIEALDTLAAEGIRPGWTVGLMPVLLEQLRHPRFQEGFAAWLVERAARADVDAGEFERWGDARLVTAARDTAARFRAQAAAFDALGRDIPGALQGRDGVELLTSNATHAFHPLVLHDACARAQLRAGLATSERHFGHAPRAMWLPECAYRPAAWWTPPVVHGDPRRRAGVAELAEGVGVQAFVVDTHLVTGALPIAHVRGDRFAPVGELVPEDAWHSELEPYRVVEDGAITGVTVLARCPDVSEQVWSGVVGYPGDPRYREFHKRHGLRGLPYWRVTGRGTDLADKAPYVAQDATAAAREHAEHFVGVVQRRLVGHRGGTGREGIVCAPFDAELFGHWWHEGPRFLVEVARALARLEGDDAVLPATLSEALDATPADKAVALPEGTWGEGGDHRVWLNEELTFYWELAYRAEDRFLDLWHRADWERDEALGGWLTAAARQLLLLQASDWAFVIHTRGAVDYGLRRILDHAARFDDLCNAVEDLLAGRAPDPVAVSTRARCELVDPAFDGLHLGWWA